MGGRSAEELVAEATAQARRAEARQRRAARVRTGRWPTLSAWLRRAGAVHLLEVLVFVPAAAMLIMLATVGTCLTYWRRSRAAVPGLYFPAVSEVGVDEPQKLIYQLGFFLCGSLLFAGICMYEELALPHLIPAAEVPSGGTQPAANASGARHVSGDSSGDEADDGDEAFLALGMMRNAHLAACGVVVQGVFTLERGVTLQSCIHWGGAVCFIMGAMRHAKDANQLYKKASANELPLMRTGALVARAYRLRRIILDFSSKVVFIVPLLVQIVPRAQLGLGGDAPGGGAPVTRTAGGKELPMDVTSMNAMGIAQWWIILQFALFFCTYVADMLAAVPLFLQSPTPCDGEADDTAPATMPAGAGAKGGELRARHGTASTD